MYIKQIFKRLLGVRDEQIIPPVCYVTCNNAFKEADRIGKVPALCEPESTYQGLLRSCSDCVGVNIDNITTSLRPYFKPEFAQLLEYCASLSTSDPVYSKLVSQASVISSLQAEASAVRNQTITVVQTVAPASTTSNSPFMPTETASFTSTPEPSSESSKAWIAGAVVGPIFIIVVIVVALLWMRRRKRKLGVASEGINGEKADRKSQEKAQLHADSIAVPRYELEDDVAEEQPVSELPAREPVGSELAARKHDGEAN